MKAIKFGVEISAAKLDELILERAKPMPNSAKQDS